MSPFQLGSLRLRNRIVMLPMGTGYADSRGYVTRRTIDYYAERAKGEVGLIVTEIVCVSPEGRAFSNQLNIYDDSYVPGLGSLAKAIKGRGACCLVQLHHAGRRAGTAANGGVQPVAPSPIPVWKGRTPEGDLPRELTLDEIARLVEAYSQAARRAMAAGFDGIELHFDHGYLPAQFFSPLTNKRLDKYGGSLESRIRFGVEIVESVRRTVGDGPVVDVRFCADEFILGGLSLAETRKMAHLLEQAGATLFSVGGGYSASSEEGYYNARVPTSHVPMSTAKGCFVHLAEEIKKVIKAPVVAGCRMDDFKLANQVIDEGRADLIGIGRGLIADPYLPAKFRNNSLEDIRKCLACNTCVTTLRAGAVGCAINAEAGRESEYKIQPASRVKKVLVIGGGPGGMEAARVALLRGHAVTLIEKKPHLGGTLRAAAAPSFKKDVWNVVDYLSTQLSKLGANVLLNTEANEQSILRLRPDVVILATGASPVKPAVNGIEKRNVTDAVEVLEGKRRAGKRAVVVGGGMVGCEVASFLAEKGKEVVLVTRRPSDFNLSGGGLAPDMEPDIRRWFLFELWPRLGIEVISHSTLTQVTDEGLVVLDGEGKQRLIEADTVVLALGMRPNNDLKGKLEGKVPEIYEVGDCVRPRKIIDAVHEASRIARSI